MTKHLYTNQLIQEKSPYLLQHAHNPVNWYPWEEEPFAIAKISGIGMCQAYNKQYGVNFITAIPTNIYGPQDHFDP